ncbi:hypothetical protein D3C80_1252940 [compost metagenome]
MHNPLILAQYLVGSIQALAVAQGVQGMRQLAIKTCQCRVIAPKRREQPGTVVNAQIGCQ